VNRILRMILLASVMVTACAPVKTQPPTTTTAVAPSETLIPSPTFTSTPTTTPEPSPTATPMPLNDPTPMDYEALRAGPVEMTVGGEAVTIEDFVRKYVETGAFSAWLVDQAERNGTLPTGSIPEGGVAGARAAEYQISTSTMPETAKKFIQAGVPVGNLTNIKVILGYNAPQEFARSQGVWEVRIPASTAADKNRDGTTSLWVRGVVLATGDPEHPYVGVPVVHVGLNELGGFDANKSTMEEYCRPYTKFSAVKDDPSIDEKRISISTKNTRYIEVIATLHSLGLDNEGFSLPEGLSWTGPMVGNPTKKVDPSLRPVTEADLGWLFDFIYKGRLDWERARRVVVVDTDRF
jgi:hypothetical protein